MLFKKKKKVVIFTPSDTKPNVIKTTLKASVRIPKKGYPLHRKRDRRKFYKRNSNRTESKCV